MDWFRSLLGLPVGASTFAGQIDALHAFVITTTMLVSLYVFLAAAYYTARYHRGESAREATTPKRSSSGAREAAMIAVILSVFLLWWVIGFVQYVNLFTPPADAMTVVVTGKQWMWKFTYPDGRDTNDVLYVPVHRKVRLLMTSRDVIHSFYVPAFRMKHDLLPGRYMTAWFEATEIGEYDIFCAEYCGTSHSRMLGRVVVLSEDDFQRWQEKEGRERGGEDLAQRGLGVATRRACVTCHTLNGQPHVGPTWARLYGSTVHLRDGTTVVADDAYLTRSMMEPNAEIVAGFQPLMPSYAGQLSPAEVGALVELIRSLRDAPVPAGVALPTFDVNVLDAGAEDSAPLASPGAEP